MFNSKKLSLSLAIIVISIIVNVAYLYNYKESLIDKSKQEIIAVLEKAKQQASIYVEQHQSGTLSKTEAEQKLLDTLTSNNKGSHYIWINDNHAISRAHIRPEIIGKFQTSYIEHIKALENEDIAFITKTNIKPGIEQRVYKINGFTKLPKWDWVIGYGVYLDEVEQAVLSKIYKMLPINILILCFCGLILFINRTKN